MQTLLRACDILTFSISFCHKDNLLKPEIQQIIRRKTRVQAPILFCLTEFATQSGYLNWCIQYVAVCLRHKNIAYDLFQALPFQTMQISVIRVNYINVAAY